MPAAYNNLYVEQNATYNTNLKVDSISSLLGTPEGQIRKYYYSANAAATFDTTIYAGNNTINLHLDSDVTANIAPGRYVYDVIVNDSANNMITRILEGVIDVSPSVTR
jgi:hypothetical protein